VSRIRGIGGGIKVIRDGMSGRSKNQCILQPGSARPRLGSLLGEVAVESPSTPVVWTGAPVKQCLTTNVSCEITVIKTGDIHEAILIFFVYAIKNNKCSKEKIDCNSRTVVFLKHKFSSGACVIETK
jgi:hypothetical protein